MSKNWDKNFFAKYSNDEEDILCFKKFADKFQACQKSNHVTYTKFVNTAQSEMFREFIRYEKLQNVFVYGGLLHAERNIIICLPDYLQEDDIEGLHLLSSLRVISRGDKLSHRDFLGSILGLKIERTLIGDIHVHDLGADIVVLPEICDFIEQNLIKVGRTPVQVLQNSISQIILPQKEIKTITGTISSPRLDALLSLGFSISRVLATKLISSGKVYQNHKIVMNNDAQVKEGDTFSIRTYGKIEIAQFEGISRKGRLFIKILKYI